MSLKDYGKIEIQKDLDNLLLKVQKELKKKMFPRKHTKLLWRDVKIELGELGENTMGSYEIDNEQRENPRGLDANIMGGCETIEDKEHKHKFSHKIIINNLVYDEYKNGLMGLGVYKRYCKKRIKDTIAHELIHAYVYEKYEWCGYDYGFHKDGSPIFLSILTFLGLPSGHDTMRSFKHTELYKKVKEFSNFEVLEVYLIHLSIEYEKTFGALENIILGKDKKVYSNNFEFSNGKITGVKGKSTLTLIAQGYIGKVSSFIIGPNTDVNNLKELVFSKIDRNVFERKYVMPHCESIEDKKNKYKLQSMNI